MRAQLTSAVLALLVVVSCGGSQPSFAPDSALSEQCDAVPSGARRVVVPAADGFRMGAALLGPAKSREGVVISYGQGQVICDWLGVAEQLATTGARVLVLERRGKGSSPGKRNYLLGPGDVASAANYLSSQGAQRIVVIGASLGTLFAFIGSSRSGPRVAIDPSDTTSAVVSRSPCAVALVSPLVSVRANGGELRNLDVQELQSKIFVVYESRNATISDDAKQVQARAGELRAPVVQSLAVDTKDHGLRLVREHAEALDVLKAAVRACG